MTQRYARHVPAALYVLSGALVLLGGYFLASYLRIDRCVGHDLGYTSWLSNWDGQWYQYIADRGYLYVGAGGYGPQVFFPLYPLLGRLVATVSPARGQLPLIIVSWLAAWGFCVAWMRYAALRLAPAQDGAVWGLALILFWPLSYFLRVAYTESLYLFLLTLFFYGCAKRWHPLQLVALTGLLSATRPTAIVACAVLALHVFERYRDWPIGKRLMISAAIGGVSAWGLYGYMAYLQVEFGDAFLFAKRQLAWNYHMPADVFLANWQEMLSFRPTWGFLVDDSLQDPSAYAWNVQNRVSWLGAVLLVVVGRVKRWLNAEEFVFCVLSMALIYVTSAPKNMESVGRYLFALVPLYLVMTRLLLALPVALRVGLLAFSAVVLTVQSAHFRMWACVF